jgi:hypothetical protein
MGLPPTAVDMMPSYHAARFTMVPPIYSGSAQWTETMALPFLPGDRGGSIRERRKSGYGEHFWMWMSMSMGTGHPLDVEPWIGTQYDAD